MNSKPENNISTAEIVLPCFNFDETFKFFTEELNFKIISIFPADNPKNAVVLGYGLQIRLQKTDSKENELGNLTINLKCFSVNEQNEIVAPNGVKINYVDADNSLKTPEFESKFVFNKFSVDADWMKGRADMRYRDLIPERLGGNVIASHIHIPKGGNVPDYVHYHNIYFQMIYCKNGWAKLVYEDQGEPFIFKAGDCVLQPPLIRHRVLESSDNLEVIEVSSPAEHETFAEHEICLPTDNLKPNRDFKGQKFIHHKAENAVWENHRIEGFECRDTGISDATNDLASVKVIHPKHSPSKDFIKHENPFCFMFILEGKTDFQRKNEAIETLHSNDSLVVPANSEYSFLNCSDDLEMLEVLL